MDAALPYLFACAFGAASGALVWTAWTLGWVRWIMLTPFAVMLYVSSPAAAALGGLVFGIVAGIPAVIGKYPFNRRIERVISVAGGVIWAVAGVLGAWLWPDGNPTWGLAAVPGTVLLANAIPVATSGRTATLLLQTVQRSLPIAHIARLGSPQVIPVVLAAAGLVPLLVVMSFVTRSPADAVAAGVALLVVLAAVLYGRRSFHRARVRADTSIRVRVAAVSRDLSAAGDQVPSGPEQRAPFEEVVAAYEPLVRQAARDGAELIVLPETVAFVHGEQRALWEETLRHWAARNATTIVAGLFDEDQTRNRLIVVDPRGEVVGEYDKRHPLRGGEPVQPSRQPPVEVDGPLPVSALICYDLDFSDYRRAVTSHGGVLAAPSNDWREFADLHDGLAVWAPVMTGVPLVRATGHGTSAVFDAAGRRIASASSFDGAVVLLADVPVG